MLNPQEYLKLREKFNNCSKVKRIAISLIEKEMLSVAEAQRLPWIEITILARIGEELREEISQEYIDNGWSLVASTQEGEETRFVFCTKEMMKDWFSFREKISYDDSTWNVLVRKDDL